MITEQREQRNLEPSDKLVLASESHTGKLSGAIENMVVLQVTNRAGGQRQEKEKSKSQKGEKNKKREKLGNEIRRESGFENNQLWKKKMSIPTEPNHSHFIRIRI